MLRQFRLWTFVLLVPYILAPSDGRRTLPLLHNLIRTSNGSHLISPVNTCPCNVKFSLVATSRSFGQVESLDIFIVTPAQREAALAAGTFPDVLAKAQCLHHVPQTPIISTRFLSRRLLATSCSISGKGDFAIVAKGRNGTFFDFRQVRLSFESSVHQAACPIVLPEDSTVSGPAAQSPTLSANQRRSAEQVVLRNAVVPPERLGSQRAVRMESDSNSASALSFIVTFMHFGFLPVCSGSLIAPKWVLATASCFIQTSMVVGFGKTPSRGETRRIRRVINHPNYPDFSGLAQYNIALVELRENAPSNYTGVALHSSDVVPEPGSFAREFRYDFNDISNDYVLRISDFPLYLNEECSRIFRRGGFDDVAVLLNSSNLFMCAGYGVSHACKRNCSFSLNSVLVQYDEGGERAIQIGTRALQTCIARLPTVFLHSKSIVDWIEEQGVVVQKATSTRAVFSEGSEEVATLQEVEVPGTDTDDEDDSGDGSSTTNTAFDDDQDESSSRPVALISVLAVVGIVVVVSFLGLAVVYKRRDAKRRGDVGLNGNGGGSVSSRVGSPSSMMSDEELKKVLEMIEVMENGEATKDERGNQRDGDVEEHGERATTEIDKTQGAPQSLAEDRISEDRISEDRIEANPVQPPRRHR